MRIQGPHYTWLAEHLTGTLDLPFHYCIWNRKDQQWDVLTTHINKSHVEAGLRTTFEWAKTIKANAFPANPAREEWGINRRGWICSPKWCDSWNICEVKGYLQDGDRASLKGVRKVPVSW